MAVRLLSYVSLLWQDLIKRKQLDGDGRLPAILPIVLYNGDDPWTAPVALRGLLTPSIPAVDRHQPDFAYLFLDENRLPVRGRSYLHNVMAGIAALEQNPSLERQQEILANFAAYLDEDPELSQVVRQWVSEILLDDGRRRRSPRTPETFRELNTMILTKLKRERERLASLYLAEGKAEGVAEGLIISLLSLVADGDLAPARALTRLEHMAEQQQISLAQLRRAKASLRKRRP
jgi:hypothetical protein